MNQHIKMRQNAASIENGEKCGERVKNAANAA
jgi:hypothetical protein